MKRIFILIPLIAMITTTQVSAQQQLATQKFLWTELPSIPDPHGFAGSFAGVTNNVLVVAGGANFPDGGAPWAGSKKVWSDKVFVLEGASAHWKEAGKLPESLGYGVSVTYHNQLICFGGSNEKGHSKKVLGLSYDKGKITIIHYPDMPQSLANSSGVLLGNIIYIAGGLKNPTDTVAGHNFWSLDLAQPLKEMQWRQLETWPGPPRMLSVTGTDGKGVYLFSGTALHNDGKDGAQRTYLKDAYYYKEGQGWHRLQSLPHSVTAAPGPAYHWGNFIFIFGGDDGKLAPQANMLRDKHPGFSTHILAYAIKANKWLDAGQIKTSIRPDAATNPNGSLWAPVTTSVATWHGSLVFAGGEVRPAVRTPKVLMVKPLIK